MQFTLVRRWWKYWNRPTRAVRTRRALQVEALEGRWAPALMPLSYTAPAGNALDDLMLHRNGANLEIVDNLTSNVVAQQAMASTNRVIITGADGEADRLTVDFSGGFFTTPVTFAGGSGTADALILQGGTTVTSSRHAFAAVDAGSVDVTSGTLKAHVDYTGLESINDKLTVAGKTFVFPDTNNDVVLTDDTSAVQGVSQLSSNLGGDDTEGNEANAPTVVFSNPTTVLTIMGNSGADTITLASLDPDFATTTKIMAYGQAGDDAFDVSSFTHAASMNGGAGLDTILATNDADFTLTTSSLSRSTGGQFGLAGIDNAFLTGGAGGNTIDAAAFSGTTILDGQAGNDILKAGARNSVLVGGAGNDSLQGGLGADILAGDAGDDTLTGGGGNDFLDGGPGTNLLSGGLGVDTWVILGSIDPDIIDVQTATKKGTRVTNSVTVQQDTFSDLAEAIDRLYLSGDAGDDTITISGSPAAEISGGDGNDILQGGSRNDRLYGGAGNDQMDGRGGNDFAFGGSDNDTVAGGTGNDTLVASGGTDALQPGAGANAILAKGLANPDAGSTVDVSSTVPFALQGSLHGFTGRVEGTATVTATMDANGIITGTFTATGSGSGTGTGAFVGSTATFTFTATGTVSGPLNAVVVKATYTGTGTVTDAEGPTSGSLSGSWSGVVSYANGVATQNMKEGTGGAFQGTTAVPQFTTNVSAQQAMPANVPDKVRKSLLAAELLESADLGNLNLHALKLKGGGPTNFDVYEQLKTIAHGNNVKNTSGKEIIVDTRLLEFMRDLDNLFGSDTHPVTVTDIVGGKHAPKGRHPVGAALDLDLLLERPVNTDTWDLNTPAGRIGAVKDMFDFGLLPSIAGRIKQPSWEIGLGVKQEVLDAATSFADHVNNVAFGNVLVGPFVPRGKPGLGAVTVAGTDADGKRISITFFTDDPRGTHLHIGIPY